MDTPIFEEPQNTGNAELKPDRHDRAAAFPRPASTRGQADIDAAFSAMTAGDVARSAPRLSDENPAQGRLTLTGADAATIEQFTRLSGIWQRGELSLEDFAEAMQRGQLPD